MSENQDNISTDLLPTNMETLVNDIMLEKDPSKTKDLVDLFNWNMSKRNISRLHKLNNLYDSITDKMVERVDKRADTFTNSDLLDYVKTIQGAIDTNNKNLSHVQEPPLIVNNTQVNVNIADNFDKDAKARILAAVEATLKQAQQQPTQIITAEYKEDEKETP